MKLSRREFFISAVGVAATACSGSQSDTSPSSTATTPLAQLLRTKGYTVVVEHSLDGGSDLIVDGKKQKIIIAGKFIGIDDSRSVTAPDNRPLTFDVANFPVPAGVEPTFA